MSKYLLIILASLLLTQLTHAEKVVVFDFTAEEYKKLKVKKVKGKTSWSLGSNKGGNFIKGTNVYLSLHPDSKEEADRLFKELSKGGKVEMPMEDQFWGDYFGSFTDKFGIKWMINYSDQKREYLKI